MNDKEKLIEILNDSGMGRTESAFVAEHLIKCGVTLKKPVIDLKDDFFGAVLNCAVRYAIGRRSYMPGLVVGFIRPLIPHLSNKTLWCFEKDIAEEMPGGLGDPQIDAPKWIDFLGLVRAELKERKEHD